MLVWIPPGLTIVPLTVTVPFSSMLDDESTRPGAANAGAGSLMATIVWRRSMCRHSVAQGHADAVPGRGVARVVVRGGEGVRPGGR